MFSEFFLDTVMVAREEGRTMERCVRQVFLVLVFATFCRAGYLPVSGDLLEHWNDSHSFESPETLCLDARLPPDGVHELRIADVREELGRPFETANHYAIYLDMLTERDPEEQIPEGFLERIGGSSTDEAATAPFIQWWRELPLETHLWVPVHMDGCEVTEDGGIRLRLSRRADPSLFEHGVRALWTILIDPDGSVASLESLSSSSGLRLTTGTIREEMPGSLFLIACTESGDTLWTHDLACDEYCHSAFVTVSDGGDLLVSIHPDCFSELSVIERVSDSGESVFGQVLNSFTLLGLPQRDGETSPMVLSQALTSTNDVLLTGYVREWMTTPAAWFICLLEGATGELLWKAAGFGLGESEICDAIELPGGRILAVGSTWEWDDDHITSGTPRPFLIVLDPSGQLLDSLILEEVAGCFQSLISHPADRGRFLLAQSGGDPERLTLLEMTLPLDQDSWSASWQDRTPEE